jgi:spoIIIJ-associated protein
MSDRVFSGRDVTEALGMAAQALGLPPERLRYVVLDTGTPGGLGLKATPARVAVLLGGAMGGALAPRSREAAPVAAAPPAPEAPIAPEAPMAAPTASRAETGDDVGAAAEKVVAALAAAAQVDIRAFATLKAEALVIELAGGDAASFLLGPEEPAVVEALEHLLHGMFAHRIAPRRLRVECQGQREQREQRLRAKALELAAAVLKDGQLRTTDPLNAYERRLVHMAVAEQPGVITYSVGGGADRRVTVAPQEASLGGEVY